MITIYHESLLRHVFSVYQITLFMKLIILMIQAFLFQFSIAYKKAQPLYFNLVSFDRSYL